MLFTRQGLPTLDRSKFAPASGLHKGAYVLADLGGGEPEMILMASGSEVSLIVEAGQRLAADGVNVRLVSFPSWELFEAQDQAYKESLFPSNITARLAVEAGIPQGWHKYVGGQGDILGIDHFGASAPAKTIFEKFGFTVDHVVELAKKLQK